MKRKMGFCGLLFEKEMKEKGEDKKGMKLRRRACIIRFFLTSVRALKKISQCRPEQNMHTVKSFAFVYVNVLIVVH